MQNRIDWIFIAFLFLGVVGHLFGTFALVEIGSNLFVWSMAGVLAAALVVALNILRKFRKGDRMIAALALFGSLGWVVIAILFGRAMGNSLDARSVSHAVAALGCAFFSWRAMRA